MTAVEDDPLAGWRITIQRTIHRSQDAIFRLLSDVEWWQVLDLNIERHGG